MFALPNSYFTEKVVGSTHPSYQLPCLVPRLLKCLGEHETASDRTTGHQNVKCCGKVRWEDWAFLSLPFPPFFARNQNRSIRSRLRISETAPGYEAASCFGILEQTVSTVKC